MGGARARRAHQAAMPFLLEIMRGISRNVVLALHLRKAAARKHETVEILLAHNRQKNRRRPGVIGAGHAR